MIYIDYVDPEEFQRQSEIARTEQAEIAAEVAGWQAERLTQEIQELNDVPAYAERLMIRSGNHEI